MFRQVRPALRTRVISDIFAKAAKSVIALRHEAWYWVL